jgi:hypothetical protein
MCEVLECIAALIREIGIYLKIRKTQKILRANIYIHELIPYTSSASAIA